MGWQEVSLNNVRDYEKNLETLESGIDNPRRSRAEEKLRHFLCAKSLVLPTDLLVQLSRTVLEYRKEELKKEAEAN